MNKRSANLPPGLLNIPEMSANEVLFALSNMSRGGSTANNTNNNTGGGLFGQKPATRGSSLFGGNNTNTGATSGGLFSSLSNNNQQNTESSSLFGGGQNNNQQKPSGLFGGSTNNSTRGGLFGGGLGQSNNGLRQFKDFPKPCILFEDILPIFADPQLHEGLLRGLELSIEQQFGASGATREVAYVECFYGFQVIQRKSLRRMLLSLGLLTKRMWVTCLRRRISTMQVELTPA
jgi:hypothetical protein